MDRKEALDFLELPEFATPDEIAARVESKLAYYEMLSEKAPSAFVRRLHIRNVARVKDIMDAAKTWPVAPMQHMTGPVQMPEVIENAAPPPPPPPVREIPEAKYMPPVQEAPPPPPPPPPVREAPPVRETSPVRESAPVREQPAGPKKPEPVGWLIRHTENQSSVSYPIYAGKNYIGRKEKPGLTPFIKVEEDSYISKVQAVIIAESSQSFFLADDLANNGDKPSTNGTYLNGKDEKVSGRTKLANNDTIQIGITKLMFRYNDNALDDILEDVAGKDYMHTVVIHGL